MMTKDETSDLKSRIARLVSCELEMQQAVFARDEASAALERWLWEQSNAKKDSQ